MTLIITANGSIDLFSDALNVGMYTDDGRFNVYYKSNFIDVGGRGTEKLHFKMYLKVAGFKITVETENY